MQTLGQEIEGRHTGTSDGELLRRIASGRDHEAFNLLYQRYERQAYALARSLLYSPQAIQDALQEALLKVWSSAHLFRHDVNPRGWILRIVALECIRQYRRRGPGNLAWRDRETALDDLAGPLPAVEGDLIRAEDLQALRKSLNELSEQDRQILVLHFLSKMNQREIGKALSLSQQTVSRRMQLGLDALRRSLARLGPAWVLPPVQALANAVDELLTTPAPDPRVLEAVRVAVYSKCQGRRPAWLAPRLLVPAAGLLGCAALLASLQGVTAPAKPFPPEAPAKATSSGSGAADRAGPAAPPVFDLQWHFDQGLPAGFENLLGQWDLLPSDSPGTKGGLTPRLKDREALVLGIPELPAARNLEITTELFLRPQELRTLQLIGLEIGWLGPSLQPKSRKEWYHSKNIPTFNFQPSSPPTFISRHYLLGKYIVQRVQAETSGQQVGLQDLQVYADPNPGARIYLRLIRANLRSIRVRTLALEELPADLNNLEPLHHHAASEAEIANGTWVHRRAKSVTRNPGH